MDDGRLQVIFESSVKRIEKDSVLLSYREDGIDNSFQLANDFVFVCAGGEPPYDLLRSFGVRFNADMIEQPDSGLTVSS